jgi:RNA polymerase sigma-70 factor (ECF subfamily)
MSAGRHDRRDDGADEPAALILRWRRAVVDICARRLGNLEEAEAVAHDALLRALGAQRTETLRSFPAYVMRIAHNLTTDVLRRRRFERVAPEEAEKLFVEAPDVADHARLHREVAELPEPYREVVLLHYTHGLSFAEIAATLSMSKNAVFARHQRAVRLLRARFATRRK